MDVWFKFMKKLFAFAIILTIVVCSENVFAAGPGTSNLNNLNQLIKERVAELSKTVKNLNNEKPAPNSVKANNTTNKGLDGKVSLFITKYLYRIAFERGVFIGGAWGAMRSSHGTFYDALNQINANNITSCNYSVSGIKQYVTKLNHIVPLGYFNSIKNDLYKACMIGIIQGISTNKG